MRAPRVLDDFSLKLDAGGVYGLLGPNGAGKSTLLQLIAGVLTPCSGKVTFDGIDTRRRLPATVQDIFFVLEEIELPPVTLDKFVRCIAPLYPRFSMEQMRGHLEMFEIDDANLRLDALSMGQKKKVFMCFAMSCNTRVLLMDEPTNGLDIPGKSSFRRFVARAMNDDRIFMISTHQVRDVEQLLDHIIIMNSSTVMFNRSVAEIQSHLRFVRGADADTSQGALFGIPSMAGNDIVLPNTDGQDTDVNLELLFDFALKDPQLLNSQFNDKPATL